MNLLVPTFFFFLIAGCAENNVEKPSLNFSGEKQNKMLNTGEMKTRHFAGAFSNGMKGDSIMFTISADGKKLEGLTFKGYWRCSGKLEQTIVGPEGSFTIHENKVDDHISEPPNGGSTAWRYDLHAVIDKNIASGTFRMNINNLGCDTYVLKWTAKSN